MNLDIGNFKVGLNKVFIIAEIGNNHNGSIERAIEMVDQAKDIGVDAVKFQMRNLSEVYREKSLNKQSEDLGSEYIIDLLDRFELSLQEHKKISEYCSKIGIQYMCTPWDEESLSILESFKVPAYKVASADLTNLPLLESLSKTKKPLILSTGMSTDEEVLSTIEFLNKRNVKFAMLHCNSTYPAPYHDINLNWMKTLSEYHPLIGYSGHERGIFVTLAAVSLGAKIIERHFTLDRKMEGPDHSASLEYDDFKTLVEAVRIIEDSLGNAGKRIMSQGEMINRENLAKSIVASKQLKKGKIITANDLQVKSPGQGISPQRMDDLIGQKLKRNMEVEDFFYESDLDDAIIEPKKYSFKMNWGVPVRYHDYKDFVDRSNYDLVEFHLSYSDMELDPKEFIEINTDINFVVHAPEMFKNSSLMDLASQDNEYLDFSLTETQKVIDITKNLKKYFPKTSKPLIVANIGGMSMDKNFSSNEKLKAYDTFQKSLDLLDLDGVELIPQNMAPFPWHFGGQRYQNLFVHPEEILEYCKKYNLRICLDISHTSMMCNQFNYDLYEVIDSLAPITAHLHIGDAYGVNGEGLQIGEGNIDFIQLKKILHNKCPTASFIPEIWQGHKDNGSAFWFALNELEKMGF